MKKLGLLVTPLMAISLVTSCEKTYHVKFTNGDEIVQEKNYKVNEEIIPPADPKPYEKDHKTYTFDAWYDGEDKFVEGTKATKNVEYIAKFNGVDIQYDIVFDNEDGSSTTEHITVGKPTLIAPSHASTKYYTGVWKEEEGGLEIEGGRPYTFKNDELGNHTLVWRETITEYEVKFTYKDKSSETKTIDVNNLSLTAPKIKATDPATGYYYAWVSNDLVLDSEETRDLLKEKGELHSYDFTESEVATTYTIDYQLDGGTLTGDYPTNYTVNEDVDLKVTPTQDDFTFSGWYLDEHKTHKLKLSENGWKAGEVMGNVTLYADWHVANKTLDQYTWKEISDISAQDRPDKYFDIGETKTVRLTDAMEVTDDYPLRIIDFKRDTLKDSSGKVGITFEFAKEIFIHVPWGYTADANRDFARGPLNNSLNVQGGDKRSVFDMVNEIQDDSGNKLMDFIKPVNKDYRKGDIYGGWDDASYDAKLFPLSYDEIGGNERTSYNYYVGADDDTRMKVDSYYCLRSPYEEDYQYVWYCGKGGKLSLHEFWSGYDVAPAFCI